MGGGGGGGGSAPSGPSPEQIRRNNELADQQTIAQLEAQRAGFENTRANQISQIQNKLNAAKLNQFALDQSNKQYGQSQALAATMGLNASAPNVSQQVAEQNKNLSDWQGQIQGLYNQPFQYSQPSFNFGSSYDTLKNKMAAYDVANQQSLAKFNTPIQEAEANQEKTQQTAQAQQLGQTTTGTPMGAKNIKYVNPKVQAASQLGYNIAPAAGVQSQKVKIAPQTNFLGITGQGLGNQSNKVT